MADRTITTVVNDVTTGDEVFAAGGWRHIVRKSRAYEPPDFRGDAIAGTEHEDSREVWVLELQGSSVMLILDGARQIKMKY